MQNTFHVNNVICSTPLLRLFPSSGVAEMVSDFSSTLSCPIRPPHLTPHFPYLFYKNISIWFSVFLSVCFLVLVHLTFFLALPFFLLLACSYHFSLFSVIFFVTDATFTDPFTSFFVTPHIHLSIPISITSSLLSWLFVVSHVSEPYTQWTIIIVAMVICQVMSPVTVSHFDDITIFPPPPSAGLQPTDLYNYWTEHSSAGKQ